MARHVVFLRGVNVGGHRRFRPSRLAERLRHLDAINIGAAGTLVIGRPIDADRLRDEVARDLPFDTEIVVCRGADVLRLLGRDHFAGHRSRPDVVQFVSILARRPRAGPKLPLRLPARGEWLVRLVAREGRFVVGVHRRRMQAIGCLGSLDRLFGVPVTTRSWTTMAAVGRALEGPGAPAGSTGRSGLGGTGRTDARRPARRSGGRE